MTSQTFTTAGHTFVDHTLSAAMLTVCQDDPADFRLVFDHTPEGLRDLYALLQTPAAQTLIASLEMSRTCREITTKGNNTMTSQTFKNDGYTLTDYTMPNAMLTVCEDVPADFRLVFDNTPAGLRDLYELLQTPAAQTLIASVSPPAPRPTS